MIKPLIHWASKLIKNDINDFNSLKLTDKAIVIFFILLIIFMALLELRPKPILVSSERIMVTAIYERKKVRRGGRKSYSE